MAPIASKMPKITTTFMVVISLTFLKMKDSVIVWSCFTKVRGARKRLETLSNAIFFLAVPLQEGRYLFMVK